MIIINEQGDQRQLMSFVIVGCRSSRVSFISPRILLSCHGEC